MLRLSSVAKVGYDVSMSAELSEIIETPGPNRLDRSFPGTLADMFDVPQPLEVEIGSGKGKFLIHRAEANPDINFVGFDYIWKYLKIGWERAQKRDMKNLLFFKAEANEVVEHLIRKDSVSVFHVYFPDPWHKRKHHKRRLLTSEFFDLLHTRLMPGGKLEIATDNFDYMIAFKSSLIEAGESIWSSARETVNERPMNPELATNFEAKYEAEGRDLYYFELEK